MGHEGNVILNDKGIMMETRSNYILVGGFVLSFFVAMVLFIIWIGHTGFGTKETEYDIRFKGSVSGLKRGSVVSYRGVPIGHVHDIILDPNDVEQIVVRVRIQQDVPIKQDMQASLETQGLTGASLIQIQGGTQSSPLLQAEPGLYRPVIPSKSSLLEQVTGTVPEVLAHVSRLLEEIRIVFSDENRQAFTLTMQNIERITNLLVPSKEHPKTLITELESAAKGLDAALIDFRGLLEENRKGFKEFSTNGVTSFQKFLTEGRDAFAAIRRISESLERSPSRFFYNDPKQGVKVR
jgi:phospholipid/cholesterol/gamma-HCH transport system substrate-binding protein